MNATLVKFIKWNLRNAAYKTEKKIADTKEMAIEILEWRRLAPLVVLVSGDEVEVEAELDVEVELLDLVVPAKGKNKITTLYQHVELN